MAKDRFEAIAPWKKKLAEQEASRKKESADKSTCALCCGGTENKS